MRVVIIVSLIMFTNMAHAEVSDKIASIENMWAVALGFGIISIVLSLRNIWLTGVGVLFALFYLSAYYDLHTDDNLYDAIINEQGKAYFSHAYGSCILLVSLVLLGAIVSAVRNKNHANQNT